MRMNRKALNLLVDIDLVKKARNHGLNLSKFFENQLRGYFNFIEGKHNNYYHTISLDNNEVQNNNIVAALSGFEPLSLAPKAKMLTATPQGYPNFLVWQIQIILINF